MGHPSGPGRCDVLIHTPHPFHFLGPWVTDLEDAVAEATSQRIARERDYGGSDELVADVIGGIRQRLYLAIDMGCDRAQVADEIDQLERGAA